MLTSVALESGMTYLRLMLPGLVPYAAAQVYAGTLRETGNARLPMIAGVSGVCVNLLFNYLLAPVLGHFGWQVSNLLPWFALVVLLPLSWLVHRYFTVPIAAFFKQRIH